VVVELLTMEQAQSAVQEVVVLAATAVTSVTRGPHILAAVAVVDGLSIVRLELTR